MNAEMFLFRTCFSQTLNTAKVYPQFERICGYSSFLAELERADLDDPHMIAALALHYFCAHGGLYQFAIAGVFAYLEERLGITASEENILAIHAVGDGSPTDFYDVLTGF